MRADLVAIAHLQAEIVDGERRDRSARRNRLPRRVGAIGAAQFGIDADPLPLDAQLVARRRNPVQRGSHSRAARRGTSRTGCRPPTAASPTKYCGNTSSRRVSFSVGYQAVVQLQPAGSTSRRPAGTRTPPNVNCQSPKRGVVISMYPRDAVVELHRAVAAREQIVHAAGDVAQLLERTPVRSRNSHRATARSATANVGPSVFSR